MEFEVTDGKLILENIEPGTIELDVDDLRKVVIAQTRFAQGRPPEGRSMEQLRADWRKALDEREGLKMDEQARQIHNLHRIIESLEGQLADTTKQLNLTRKAFHEARTI